MTNSPTPPVTQSPNQPPPNPYVGPRTFSAEQRHLFFGREREARDLLARVLSERLLLFYAQSGAGKSSLLHARLIPLLQEEKGFVVLPVGRVSGELPAGVAQVDNIFVYNLLLSVDEGSEPGQLAQVSLGDFLARLARRTVLDADGQERKGWVYDPDLAPAPAGATPGARRYALIVDQFEEIITSHPARWREREDFFRQVDAALAADPNLWVVLTLREDYVAALDPYAELCFNRLRARFYMERMDGAAALEAIRRPAELGGRPFAAGVAEQLVDNLRQVRVAGQEATVAGQYVEPVQLQVVCWQMWENLGKGTGGTEGTDGVEPPEQSNRSNPSNQPAPQITFADLAAAGNVDQALTAFYEETLAAALADPAAAGVSERQVRTWFDEQLITEAGTRGLVHQGERESGGLPNGVVRALQRRFLVRGEARGGDVWIELAHDRFVEPIRQSNRAWFSRNLNPLTLDARAWREAGKPESKLYTGSQLSAAAAQIHASPGEFGELEHAFVEAGQQAESRRTARRQRAVTYGAIALLLIFGALAGWALLSRVQVLVEAQAAQLARNTAVSAQGTAVAEATRALNAEGTAVAEATRALNAEGTAVAEATRALNAEGTAVAERGIAATREAEAQKAEATAVAAEAEAVAAKAEVEHLMRQIRADQLTTNALKIVNETPLLALLLGVEGLRAQHDVTRSQPYTATRITYDFEQGTYVRESSVITREVVVGSAQTNMHELLTKVGGSVLSGHTLSVDDAAFSHDGHWLATASGDGSVRLWDLTSDDPAQAPILLRGFDSSFTGVAFSPNDYWLAATSYMGIVSLWDLTTAEPASNPILLRADENSFTTAVFSPNSRWLATASRDGTARLWDLTATNPAQESIILRGHEDWVNAVAFSPDGHWLATASRDDTARLWDLTATNPAQDPIILRGHEDGVNAVTFSPNGRWLATASEDNTARLWDLTTADPAHTPLLLRGHENNVNAVTFSPDGRWLATASNDSTARLWDLTTTNPAQEPIILRGHEENVNAVTISPDGRWLATASEDNTARLWDLTATNPAQEPIILRGHEKKVNAVTFSPDGRWLATASNDNTARLWDLSSGELAQNLIGLQGHEDRVNAVAFSPDSHWLATASDDRTARLWHLAAGDAAQDPTVFPDHAWPVKDVAFSPDGHWLATASGSTASLWNLTAANPSENPILLKDHSGTVMDVAFSPDGHWLATASGGALLWDLTAANPAQDPILLRGGECSVNALTFSPDGHWLATAFADCHSAGLWEMTAGIPMQAPIILRGHGGVVEAVAFSPDGHWLATASGSTAGLWDLTAADPAQTPLLLQGRVGHVNDLAFSPDGLWLATASWDGTVRLWNLTTANSTQEAIILQGYAGSFEDVAFSPDGRWLATASNDPTVRLWRWRVNDLIDWACRSAGRNLEAKEWQQYFQSWRYRQTCPNWPVHDTVTNPLRKEAQELAKEGDIADAVAKFEEALALDPSLPIEPQAEATRIYASVLVEEGRGLAQQGDVTGAVAKFKEALAIDPSLVLEPEVEAERSYASWFVEEGRSLAQQGDVTGAVASFEKAQTLNPDIRISASDWNTLCWLGAILNKAALVLDACETAVRLAPEDGGIRDSRGLARALTGDVPGAIEDFEFALQRATAEGFIQSRSAWVQSLRAGQDPAAIFDATTLQALRNE
jgi:WD40 repeat protein